VLSDPERTARVLERFRASGAKLSIDDFGTGYSSLTYVRTMPASELKIDRSFTRGLDTDESNAAIVRSVIGLAHSLGMQVVCEGVETEGVLRRLRELGCDHAQGFYLSRPLTAPGLASFVAESLLRPFEALVSRQRTARLPPVSTITLSRPPLSDSLRAIRIASTP
jgi:EAL domain-containing protein (putative c-di-GMP-specific phosphodiesterase class I)